MADFTPHWQGRITLSEDSKTRSNMPAQAFSVLTEAVLRDITQGVGVFASLYRLLSEMVIGAATRVFFLWQTLSADIEECEGDRGITPTGRPKFGFVVS
jgi:hypothetical protein